MTSPKERFTTVARGYARWRPPYPEELFRWIAAEAGLSPGARVADLGCGTGISTRLWRSLGFDAVGVDPNEAMLAEARAAGGEYLRGDAERTGLPDHSVDLAAAAQAFHWFDLERTLDELARVLKPGGKVAAIWNQRARTPFLKEYESLLSRYTTEYAERPKSADTLRKLQAHPRAAAPTEKEVEHVQRLDRQGFFGRVYSASYVALSLRGQKDFDRALGELFDRRQKDGAVDFAYRAVALVFGLR